MIEVKELSKQFGKKVVLDGIDVQFPKGKITSLIGSNGAGKSTLLSVISRLLAQDKGVVRVDEKDIHAYKNNVLSQRLSILKQSNHVRLKLTVRELVSFGRFPYSQDNLTAHDRQKVDTAIRFLDLQDIENMYIDELSGGQKQRAYMAMVVAQDTDYLLLDEPLNNLDMKHSVQIMKTLRRLANELGKTIIIVLHDINFASHYSDYILALKDGKVRYYDTTERIMNERVLEDIFGIPISIIEFNDKKICNYFN
ncbi:MAG TPA: iron ABC transporter ATP-binding protein [Porphyromonadaceae bacterium]|jgi:iron complex transport system ATP-binding protein|uniref:iron ABC transporter ATP-binding protein n=1 Tax=Limibacterium fermenti TaxID=3229863 RepID=UPI000E9F6C17|nr:iron ABC transporter ATP-binding protein [Porphyromonadaceae bacterium]HBK31978.1 iron ABC transporter ATP-binding protein [Porphyromonadaceae bacterium]HBL33667.1 iron ABC transporter ATP-binding protein [Porphyromonadaceae bacterium]HBX20799.1 iron ABC transporter ATP-binding protein [Porphyromonadaceae bacterium]HBX45337.1 iron ABC transporter ATP-binding protein [Porphyromonadaceae bacterium]